LEGRGGRVEGGKKGRKGAEVGYLGGRRRCSGGCRSGCGGIIVG
jgi:hypothetical protein